jgi:hypothetical protein
MNRIAISAVFLLFIASIAAAQNDLPKQEVFGGYSLMHEQHLNLNGFAAEFEHNLNSKFGFVGDFSYGRESVSAPSSSVSPSRDEFLLMIGPRISYRAETARIFFHGLVGGMRMKMKGKPPTDGILIQHPFTDFAVAFGGGIDFPINNRISVRPVQLEWLRWRTPDEVRKPDGLKTLWLNQLRYSAGIVVNIGSK